VHKIEIPALLTPEIVEMVASNPDILKTVLDSENNELTEKNLEDSPLNCPNLSSLKVAFSNVNIHIRNTEFMEDICDEKELDNKEEDNKHTCYRLSAYKKEVDFLKEQLDKISEQVNEIKEILIQNIRRR